MQDITEALSSGKLSVKKSDGKSQAVVSLDALREMHVSDLSDCTVTIDGVNVPFRVRDDYMTYVITNWGTTYPAHALASLEAPAINLLQDAYARYERSRDEARARERLG